METVLNILRATAANADTQNPALAAECREAIEILETYMDTAAGIEFVLTEKDSDSAG